MHGVDHFLPVSCNVIFSTSYTTTTLLFHKWDIVTNAIAKNEHFRLKIDTKIS